MTLSNLHERDKIIMHGWIIYNGNLPGNKFLDFAEMLQTAAIRNKHDVQIYKNNDLLSVLDQSHLTLLCNNNLTLPEYVIFTDKDIYLARQLELLGIPVFNSAESIAISDDKIATYQQLAANRLPIPRTIIAPKVFTSHKESSLNVDAVIEELNLPLIVKESFGSFGEQVYLIHTKEELVKKMDTLHCKAYIFQEFRSEEHTSELQSRG